MEQEFREGPSRVARVRDSFYAWKLGISSGLLLLLVTPMWLSFLTPHSDGLAWILITLLAYVAEIVAIVAIGRWARRVAHEEITPWSARLALALLLSVAPLAMVCGVGWWKDGSRAAAIGAGVVMFAIGIHFGSVIDRLRRVSDPVDVGAKQ